MATTLELDLRMLSHVLKADGALAQLNLHQTTKSMGSLLRNNGGEPLEESHVLGSDFNIAVITRTGFHALLFDLPDGVEDAVGLDRVDNVEEISFLRQTSSSVGREVDIDQRIIFQLAPDLSRRQLMELRNFEDPLDGR